jgi:hypothetical protein
LEQLHLEGLVGALNHDAFVGKKPSAFATFASFLFKNLFAYFCLDVFFCSDHGWMRD